MGQLYSILKKFALFKMRQTKGRHRRLPLEMECQVFECLNLEIQQKFIWRMGRGIYGMFGQQLLIKSKRLHNPKGNYFISPSIWNWPIPAGGMQVSWSRNTFEAFAQKGFDICVQRCRMGNYPGTILYYFEVTQTSVNYCGQLRIGLSDGHKFGNLLIYSYPTGFDFCYLLGKEHPFEWPNDAIRPKRWNGKGKGNVYGCGLLLNPRNELAIFFTFNGILMGKQIPISPESNHLTPTIRVKKISVEVNFGDNPAKPFKFDINKCQGLVFQ